MESKAKKLILYTIAIMCLMFLLGLLASIVGMCSFLNGY